MVIIAAAGRGCTRPIAAPGKAVGAQKPVLPGCHKEFSEVRVNPDGFLTRIINSIRGRVEYAAPASGRKACLITSINFAPRLRKSICLARLATRSRMGQQLCLPIMPSEHSADGDRRAK